MYAFYYNLEVQHFLVYHRKKILLVSSIFLSLVVLLVFKHVL